MQLFTFCYDFKEWKHRQAQNTVKPKSTSYTWELLRIGNEADSHHYHKTSDQLMVLFLLKTQKKKKPTQLIRGSSYFFCFFGCCRLISYDQWKSLQTEKKAVPISISSALSFLYKQHYAEWERFDFLLPSICCAASPFPMTVPGVGGNCWTWGTPFIRSVMGKVLFFGSTTGIR